MACEILVPWSRIEPTVPRIGSTVLTTGLPGKSQIGIFIYFFLFGCAGGSLLLCGPPLNQFFELITEYFHNLQNGSIKLIECFLKKFCSDLRSVKDSYLFHLVLNLKTQIYTYTIIHIFMAFEYEM